MGAIRLLFIILFAVTLGLVAGCGGDDCPTCPPCPERPDDPGIPADGVIEGDLRIYSQSSLEHYDGITEVTGRLTLTGHPADSDPIVDLTPLASLERVDDLEIYGTGLRDLRGLESLRVVTSYLDISHADSLISLAGLDTVSVRGLLLEFNPNLRSVAVDGAFTGVVGLRVEYCDALASLDLVGDWSELGALRVRVCPSLVEIPALTMPALYNLEIERHPTLESIDLDAPQLVTVILNDLPSLEGIEFLADPASLRNLTLWNIASLDDLGWLGDTPSLEALFLQELPDLQSLAGWTASPQLTRLTIYQAPALETLTDLPPLPLLDVLSLQELPALTSLAGLASASEISRLYLHGLISLTSLTDLPSGLDLASFQLSELGITDLTGLPTFTACDQLAVYGCSDLVGLAGLAALPGLVDLQLRNNPLLADLTGAPGTLEKLLIWGCASLEDLSGLGALPQLVELSLADNAALVNLTGPTYPAELADLWLSRNAALTNLDGLQDLQAITNWLQVDANPSLVSVAELTSLERAHNVTIRNNVALGDAAVFELLAGLEITGRVHVEGNHP